MTKLIVFSMRTRFLVRPILAGVALCVAAWGFYSLEKKPVPFHLIELIVFLTICLTCVQLLNRFWAFRRHKKVYGSFRNAEQKEEN
jgi:hypothetical protein